MNSKWFKIGVVGLVIAALVVTAAVAVAQRPGRGGGDGFGMGMGMHDSLLTIAAEQLGLEQADLVTALEDGKTVAELAEEQGVELGAIVDAFVAEHAEHMVSMVEAGVLTQEEVDARLELMTTHLTERLSQPFEAYGFGFHDQMHGGMMGGGMGRGGMMHSGMMGGMGMGQGGMGWGITPQDATAAPNT